MNIREAIMKQVFLFFSALLFVQTIGAVKLEVIAEDLERPWAVAPLEGDAFLITLKGGDLLFIDTQGSLQSVPGLPRTYAQGQGGLLDVIRDPGFNEDSPWLYFTFTYKKGFQYGTAAGRGLWDGENRRINNFEILFEGDNLATGGAHFGSRMAFDSQGFLYITLGDRHKRNEAQSDLNHYGTVIRLKPGETEPEVFTYGHRNPQGLTQNPLSGQLWLHEHGPRGGDEINILKEGANYGWPVISFGREYSGGQVGAGLTAKEGMEQPLLYWTTSIAPSGMAFYQGSLFPQWKGDLFVGALAGQHLRRVRLEGDRVIGEEPLFSQVIGRVRDVRTDLRGELIILTDGPGGKLYRVKP